MNLVDCKSALKTLKSGLPIIFPTDTLPAIGCLPKFSNTIYEFKKRDRDKPLILMGSEKKQLIDYVHESAKEDYENIASKYWPGALTGLSRICPLFVLTLPALMSFCAS